MTVVGRTVLPSDLSMGEALHHRAASARFSFAALVAVLQYTSVIHIVKHNDLEQWSKSPQAPELKADRRLSLRTELKPLGVRLYTISSYCVYHYLAGDQRTYTICLGVAWQIGFESMPFKRPTILYHRT